MKLVHLANIIFSVGITVGIVFILYPQKASAACTYPTTEVCGGTCCVPGHCAYCGCDKPLDWDGPGCGCAECPTCSTSVTCTGGVGLDCTTFTSGGACNTDFGNGYLPSTTFSKRVGIHGLSATNSCSKRWPTWTAYNGQDDIVWHDAGSFYYSTSAYDDIPLSGTNHTIEAHDSTIYVHTYINNNATYCGQTSISKCYGAYSNSGSAFALATGQQPRYSTMAVTGTATYTVDAGSTLVVGTCN